ncbi:MAG: RHS repeat-associated core domain-containing protein, partial [Bacillota bacterium]
IWYDGLSLGNISKGLVSEEKSWLDQFNGRSCSDSSFYSENSSRPNLGATDPHPVVKYTYDIVGNVTTKTKHNVWQDGSKDQTEAIQYDSSAYCLPVKYTNAKGHITSFTVDYVVGKPLTITDPNKGLTQYQYDSLGRVMSEFGPRDTVNPRVKYDYTNALTCKPLSQYVTVKRQTEVGATAYLTSQVYLDGFGRNWKTVKAAPESKTVIIEVAYDWNGLKTKEYLPRFSTASAVTPKITVYDSLQRVTSVTQPDGAATSYAYDGLKTTITDPRKHLTYQYHDCYDRLVKVEQVNDDGTYVTTNKYDALGRKIKVYDANYNAGVSNTPFLYVYDSLSRVRSSSDPYTGAAAYTYDLLGNTTSKTDAKRNQLIYHYDALNRLTQKSVLAPGATQTTVLTKNVYDEITAANGIGQLTSSYIGASTADGTYTYDLDGNVVKTVKNISGTAYTIQMTYDSRDRITKLTYPDAASISYTYDTDALSRVGGFATYSNWNASAMPRTVTYGNGVVTNYSYDDETLHLTDLKSQNPTNVLIQSFGYEFDQVGNITQITDNATLTAMHTKATSQSFEYDYLNRLTKSGLGMYDYDRVGNVIVKENVTFGYTDSSHPNCPTTGSNGYKASYDVNGNLIEKWDKNGVYWRYAYNTKNMLLAVYKGTEKGKEYLVEEYLYDSAGMRNQKKTYDGAAVAITRYVYLGNNVLYEAGTTKTRYILSGEREIAKVVGGTIYYTHRDHLGSSSVVTDSTGKVVNWNANYPYGENWQVSPAGTIDLDKHRFTGKETDASSGLIYFGARFYDPEVGRFISVDPAKQELNWYAYCGDNPVKYVDPDGKWFDTAVDIGFLAYDVKTITDNPKDLSNWAALGLDASCAFLPFVAGGGLLVRGGKAGTKLAVKAGQATAKAVKSSSKVLGKNLVKAGFKRGVDEAAHHIVAGGASKSEIARTILQNYGVGINDAVNGVFLKGSKHASQHTNKYYAEVNRLLSQATSKKEVISTLKTIAKRVTDGTFPK